MEKWSFSHILSFSVLEEKIYDNFLNWMKTAVAWIYFTLNFIRKFIYICYFFSRFALKICKVSVTYSYFITLLQTLVL
jgi:hypothetical protein